MSKGIEITYNGETKNLREWANIAGISKTAILNRYHKGLRGEALFISTKITIAKYQGQTLTIAEWAQRLKMNAAVLHGRIKNGWAIEDVLNSKKRERKEAQPAKKTKLKAYPESGDVPDGAYFKYVTLNEKRKQFDERPIFYNGQQKTISEWAKELNIDLAQAKRKLYLKYDINEVLNGEEIDERKYYRLNETLCWDCKNAVPTADGKFGCSWSRKFKPVDGWKVQQTKINRAEKNNPEKITESFIVKKCPKFIPDERIEE